MYLRVCGFKRWIIDENIFFFYDAPSGKFANYDNNN